MKPGLYTGAQSLQDESGTPLFGLVSAFGATKNAGVVRLTLDVRYMAWELNEEAITIDIPEQWARQLAEPLKKVTGQLEHLHILLRQGKLAPQALYDLSEIDSLENAPLLEHQQPEQPSSNV